MKTPKIAPQNSTSALKNESGQQGSALVIAVFVLALISVFVALALTRSATEAVAVGNETAEGRTFYAAQASLEMMTRNFNKVFEIKLNPSTTDLNAVRTGEVPGMNGFNFTQQELDQTSTSQPVVLVGGPFAGLYALRDNWRLRTTVTETSSGVQVQLTRNLLNNRIPIFQFGIFNDDDLELYRPPRFSFGGRVHTNQNFFISPGADGVYFDSRVTVSRHVVTQTWRNGNTSDMAADQTFIKNASGAWKQLFPTKGSVLNTSISSENVFTMPDLRFDPNPDLPWSKLNSSWKTDSAIFDGNLQNGAPQLKLPLKIGADDSIDRDALVEMVKRPKEHRDDINPDYIDVANIGGATRAITKTERDDPLMRSERFANKTGIRITLADSKAKLPGCSNGIGLNAVTAACGIRLDGDALGLTSGNLTAGVARGYQPLNMLDYSATSGYRTTRVNGDRLYNSGQEVWIKVETVQTNATTGEIDTQDITQDILSLGVTEQAPRIPSTSGPDLFEIEGYNHTPASTSDLDEKNAQAASMGTDSRSIIKIQRFIIPGPAIPTAGGSSRYVTSFPTASPAYNVVVRMSNVHTSFVKGTGCAPAPPAGFCKSEDAAPAGAVSNEFAHFHLAEVNGNNRSAVVPFPIEMFDTREGTWYDHDSLYTAGRVSLAGVMSMIDIDVANLRRFLRGDFNNKFPLTTPFAVKKGGTVGLLNTDIPSESGWVLYISDRRGDYDFDGEYDMEDIYGWAPGSDNVMQTGEDVNRDGVLNVDFTNEAVRNTTQEYADKAAVIDHKYYRRGVRLVNGTILPGIYDAANASNTRGFTVASENGVYVRGNYNATGINTALSTNPSPYNAYLPFNEETHIPASIVADAVTILSNNWNDAQSFAYPYDQGQRLATETTIRFAMISGDTLASKQADPHQGGISPRLNGGVHNFKRYLERWTNPSDSSFQRRLNYAGSLINLFNSRNNSGAFKCCETVYNPPVRNWVFDSTFLDAGRLPPGTPFFQYVQITGFQRTNN